VEGDLKLEGESTTCQLPRTCNIAEAQGKGAKQISDLPHEQILDGIKLRDALEEDFEETEDGDDEGSGSMSEECESEEESGKIE
jgi:hypothetical protein